MKTRMILFGGGGHAKVISDVILAEGKYEIAGVVDDKFPVGSLWNEQFKILSLEDGLKIGRGIVAIGDNFIRSKLVNELLMENSQFEFVTCIHPSSILGSHVKIGKGTVVMPRVVINSSSFLGNHLVINTGAIIEHDCVLGDFVFVAPGAVLGGNVKIEEMSMVGIGASVKQGIRIGTNTIIGMGACVIDDAQASALYINQGGVASNSKARKTGELFFK